MSGDGFSCDHWGLGDSSTAIWWVQVRYAATHPQCTGQPHTTKNYLSQIVNSTEVKKSWPESSRGQDWEVRVIKYLANMKEYLSSLSSVDRKNDSQ